MFQHLDLKGFDLPTQTLSLTYDDGPGPETLELGRFLYRQGISATFFVIGRHAAAHRKVLNRLCEWGHVLGNHTYTHPGLVAYTETGGDPVGELALTDSLIRNYGDSVPKYFRAPYGNWRQQDPETGLDLEKSTVAEALNHSGRFGHYVGPINWDISAADYDHWQRGSSPEKCARAYLDKVKGKGRGIVLMHDSSDDPKLAQSNRTLETTWLLVPALKEMGYRFVGLDSVPQIRTAIETVNGVRLTS